MQLLDFIFYISDNKIKVDIHGLTPVALTGYELRSSRLRRDFTLISALTGGELSLNIIIRLS